MKFDAWALTDLGNVRENNEDSHLLDVPRGVFVVADGVGGSEAGEVASDHLVKRVSEVAPELKRLANQCDPVTDQDARERVFTYILDLLQSINREVYDIGKEINPTLPSATTCDLVVISRNCAFIAHVGDSRIYLFRQDQIFRITEDHTFAEQLKRESVADESILERFRNVLTRSIGGKPQVEIDALFIDLHPGDRLLMCSDGVTEYLTGTDILEFASQKDGDELIHLLVRESKDRGGADNITALLVDIKEVYCEPPLRDLSLRDLSLLSLDALQQADIPGQKTLFVEEEQHFDDLALVSDDTYASSAHAMGDALVLTVPAAKFRERVDDNLAVGNKLLRNLLHMLGQEIRDLRQRPTT